MIDIVARQARLVCVFTLGRKGVNNCEDLEHGAFHQFLKPAKKVLPSILNCRMNASGLSTSFRQPIS